MAFVTLEIPDTLTEELAQRGISDEHIQGLVIQVMKMWLRTGQAYLSQELITQWLEALEDREDIRDVADAERAWLEDPAAFMTLEEFNAAYDTPHGAS